MPITINIIIYMILLTATAECRVVVSE